MKEEEALKRDEELFVAKQALADAEKLLKGTEEEALKRDEKLATAEQALVDAEKLLKWKEEEASKRDEELSTAEQALAVTVSEMQAYSSAATVDRVRWDGSY